MLSWWSKRIKLCSICQFPQEICFGAYLPNFAYRYSFMFLYMLRTIQLLHIIFFTDAVGITNWNNLVTVSPPLMGDILRYFGALCSYFAVNLLRKSSKYVSLCCVCVYVCVCVCVLGEGEGGVFRSIFRSWETLNISLVFWTKVLILLWSSIS